MTASWTDVTGDVVRLFSNALSPAARHHLELNYESIRYIRAACERLSPVELARIASKGISWHHPANAPALLLFRLHRESGLDTDNDNQEATRP